MIHSWCFGCGGPCPCQLRYFPSPCVCTTSEAANGTEKTETASVQAAKTTVSRAASAKADK